MLTQNDPLSDFGNIKAIWHTKAMPGSNDPVLIPSRHGIIELPEEFIQKKINENKYLMPANLKDSLVKHTNRNFAFTECMINSETEYKEDDYANLMIRIKMLYEEMYKYFEKTPDLLHRNYPFLEYHLFHNRYEVEREPKKIQYLVLYSLVNDKETLESKVLRHPTSFVNPGQALTMIYQMISALEFLVFKTTVFFGDDKNKPLLPCVPGFSLKDIWIFEKWYFKLNWLFQMEENQSVFIHPEITTWIKKHAKEKQPYTKDIKEVKDIFFNYTMNALGLMAIKFCLSGQKSQGLEEADFDKLEKHLTANFLNEFKDEADLLKRLIKSLLNHHAKEKKTKFDLNECLSNVKRPYYSDPADNLLAIALEKAGMTAAKRLEEIQNKILDGKIERDLEITSLNDFINKKLDKKLYKSTLGKDKEKETQKKNEQQKNVLLPALEIEIPLDPKDVSNISQHEDAEKVIVQIYPLYEKDFFVYRALTAQLVLSIEFNDDLTHLLSTLSERLGYINAEIDHERRIVFRSALTLQGFENELESHINALDSLALVAVLLIRKLNFCIEFEEFGRISKNTKLILDELEYHMKCYRERTISKAL